MLLVIPLLATIPLSIIALRKIKKNPTKYSGEGLARTILILGIVFTGIFIIIAIIAAIVAGGGVYFWGPS